MWEEVEVCGLGGQDYPKFLHPDVKVIFALLPLAKLLQKYLSLSSDRLLSVDSLVFLPLFIKSFGVQ